MHLILTGATGLVGSGVLRAMLLDPTVTRVSILSRRPVPQADGHEKVEVIIHPDFSSYPASSSASSSSSSAPTTSSSSTPSSDLPAKLSSATGVVWALGISQNAVSASEYEKITRDYALAFVKWWAALPTPPAYDAASRSPPERTFVYVSGEGTTHAPGRLTARFASVKGRTEQELLDMTIPLPSGSSSPAASATAGNAGATAPAATASTATNYFPNLTVYTPRPAGVDPSDHPEIQPYIPRLDVWLRAAWSVVNALRPAVNAWYPNMLSPTKELGEVLTQLAKGHWGLAQIHTTEADSARRRADGWRGGVLANRELRRLAGLRYK